MEEIKNELREIKEILRTLQPKEKTKLDMMFERRHKNG